jgi:hypothetical protein
MKAPIYSLCIVFLLIPTTNFAQSIPSSANKTKLTANPFFIKAAYLDINRSFFFSSVGGGITVILKNDLLFSVRKRTATLESPHKPDNFQVYRSSSSNNSGGLFNFGLTSPGYISGFQSGNSRPSDQCKIGCKDYKVYSLLVGKMFYNSDIHTRVSVSGGVSLLNIEEAQDFIYKVGTNGQRGHVFKMVDYSKVGTTLRLGIDFPFSKYIGISTALEGTLAKKETLVGFEVGLIMGLLR